MNVCSENLARTCVRMYVHFARETAQHPAALLQNYIVHSLDIPYVVFTGDTFT